MTANVAVRVMEGILVASCPAGFTLVEDEQKVTQWVWACLSTTGFWMFGSCNQHHANEILHAAIVSDILWWEQGLKSFVATVSVMHDLYFFTKVILLLFVVRKAESWLHYSMKIQRSDNAPRRLELIMWCLCKGLPPIAFARTFSGMWHIDQQLTYLLAFDWVNFALSHKCGYNMFWDLEWSPQAQLINLNQKWNFINSHVIVCIFVRAIGYGWKQAGVGKEHEGHINAIRRRANMLAVKFLNVTVPCSFTSDSNECITEATGWSQCKGGPPPSSRLAPPPTIFDTHHKT